MAILLNIPARKAHDEFAAFAESAAELQRIASRMGQSDQPIAHRELGERLGSFHRQGIELLNRALRRGHHAISLQKVLTTPGVEATLCDFNARVSEAASKEAARVFDRSQHTEALRQLGVECAGKLGAIVDVVNMIVAAIEDHPDFADDHGSPMTDDELQVLLAMANYAKVPDDPERGHHPHDGQTLASATGIHHAKLSDAVDRLERRGMVKRHKAIGNPIASVRLNADGRAEAARILSVSAQPRTSAANSEARLPRMDVIYKEKLGSGAFGTVWQATDQLLERDIAVKFLTTTDQALDEDALLREARSLAKATHSNLVHVYGAAWLRNPVTGLVAPAIMMELLIGEKLVDWWSRQRSRPETFVVAEGVLDGIAAMHAAGIHHGDLHPENVMVLRTGQTKLIDWRYQDTFLQKSTAHRRDLVGVDERRAIDIVVSIFEKQGLLDESLVIRRSTDLNAMAVAMRSVREPDAVAGAGGPVLAPTQQRVLEDHPDVQRERTLQLRKLEAEARILGRLVSNARNLGANDPEITLQIENLGRSGFSFDSCDWRVEWNQGFRDQLAKYNVLMPEGYVPPRGRLPISSGPLLPSGRSMKFRFKWTRLDALSHFREANVEVPGFNGAWADYHFEVVCRGELGGEEVLRWTERPTAA